MEPNTPLTVLHKTFLKSFTANDGNLNTRKMHDRNLMSFFEFLSDKDILVYEDLTPAMILDFLSMIQKRFGQSKIWNNLRSIRAFCSWVNNQSKDALPDHSIDVQPPQPQTKPTKRISKKIISRMVQSCGNDIIGLRDKAIILIISDVGIRPVDLCRLRQADFIANRIVIRSTFTTERRRLKVKGNTASAVNEYLQSIKPQSTSEWLFTINGEKPLSPSNVYEIFHRRSLLSGCQDIIRPSDLHKSKGYGQSAMSVKRKNGLEGVVIEPPGAVRVWVKADNDLKGEYKKHGPRIDKL